MTFATRWMRAEILRRGCLSRAGANRGLSDVGRPLSGCIPGVKLLRQGGGRERHADANFRAAVIAALQ